MSTLRFTQVTLRYHYQFDNDQSLSLIPPPQPTMAKTTGFGRRMNRSSEYSSGCESGWTTYFDQLSNFTDSYSRACITTSQEKGSYMSEDQGADDLSTLSDATSGPSNLQKHKEKKKGKKKSSSKETLSKKQQSLYLGDTASSPSIHFSQNESMAPYYQEETFAATYFEDESTSKKQTGFPKYSKGKSGSSLGRKRQ